MQPEKVLDQESPTSGHMPVTKKWGVCLADWAVTLRITWSVRQIGSSQVTEQVCTAAAYPGRGVGAAGEESGVVVILSEGILRCEALH